MVDPDDDYLGLEVQVANGRFSGSARIFAGLDQLSEFAQAIAGFPASASDSRTYEFGSRELGSAGGYIKLVLRCVDSAGHAEVAAVVEDDSQHYSKAFAELTFPVQAAALDFFVRALRRVEGAAAGEATLASAQSRREESIPTLKRTGCRVGLSSGHDVRCGSPPLSSGPLGGPARMTSTVQAGLGAPDLRLGPFALWVHGYQYLEAEDVDDANWLRITAHCGGSGAQVEVSGSVLQTFDLARFRAALAALSASLVGEALLETHEPDLAVRVHARHLGQVDVEVGISPNHLQQDHRFKFELDQTHLAPAAKQLESILERWPVRKRS